MKIQHHPAMEALPRWSFPGVSAPLSRDNKLSGTFAGCSVNPCRHKPDQIVKW